MDKQSIFKKLRLDPGHKILILNAPDNYTTILEDLQYDRQPDQSKKGQYDFIQVFAKKQSDLEESLKQVAGSGKYDCLFWACYPKGTGKIKSDIKRDTIWSALALVSLRPVTQISIDETWSAMRGRPNEKVGK